MYNRENPVFPGMMKWKDLLCPYRVGEEKQKANTDLTRTDFQRDFDRLIFSSPFRRLQNKTQVFPLPGSVFVHNRLTHSLEVSSVGRSLGKSILNLLPSDVFDSPYSSDIPTIISAACLAHDMGNPPFGHSGEDAFRQFFSNNPQVLHDTDEWERMDLTRFEGNANALRLLTHQFSGRRTGGFRLSYATLASIVKYPYPSTAAQKKFGFFKSEADIFRSIANETGLVAMGEDRFCRHPLVYLVEAADDICYQVMDIEDAHKLNILSTPMVIELYRNFFIDETPERLSNINDTLKTVTDTNEQVAYLRAITISKLINLCANSFVESYNDIMTGKPVKPLIEQLKGAPAGAMERVRTISVSDVYKHPKVVEIEIAGFTIIGELLDIFCTAVTEPNKALSRKALSLIPKQYLGSHNDRYAQIMSVVDFISGMTDIYALETYQLFKGIKLPSL